MGNITGANLSVLPNQSGTNTGDQSLAGYATQSYVDTAVEGLSVSTIADGTPPPAPSSAGTTGSVVFSGNYMYRCVATNTWVRFELASWSASPLNVVIGILQNCGGALWIPSLSNWQDTGGTTAAEVGQPVRRIDDNLAVKNMILTTDADPFTLATAGDYYKWTTGANSELNTGIAFNGTGCLIISFAATALANAVVFGNIRYVGGSVKGAAIKLRSDGGVWARVCDGTTEYDAQGSSQYSAGNAVVMMLKSTIGSQVGLYKNGTLQASSTGSVASEISGAGNLALGQYNFEQFGGSIYCAMYCATVPSSADLLTLQQYAGTLAGLTI